MKILITDDSQFMRSILKDILQKMHPDATFFEAGNGNEAIALCSKESPDLLLIDLIMPIKGGIDTLKELRGSFGGHVIVISAVGQEKIIEEAKSLGAKDFIVKPFKENQVVETVTKVLG